MDKTDEFDPKQYSILIIDDNPHNLQVLGKLLRENNFAIEFATSGEAALVWLKNRLFDLILLDINMPGMSGFDVCNKIRADKIFDKVPIIFLSAENDRESILKGFELGAQDYITKPFDAIELLSRVKTHLSLKDSLEKLDNQNVILEATVAERTVQLKDANEQLKDLNLKLLDLDKAKSEFLRLISHEIRTPLNGIVGPLELLKESGSSTDIEELINILDFSVKRLERFALNALLITRLKTQQFNIWKETVSIPVLLSELKTEYNSKISDGNYHIDIVDNSKTPSIIGESGLIKTCLDNVLNNAISFSPKNSNVDILIYDENENLICEFKDNGIGFKDEEESFFEIFNNAESKRDSYLGIGLPICKMIMEAHHGNITLGNNAKAGAFVKLQFSRSIG
jgi:DNA-binding response OmpR family regulator